MSRHIVLDTICQIQHRSEHITSGNQDNKRCFVPLALSGKSFRRKSNTAFLLVHRLLIRADFRLFVHTSRASRKWMCLFFQSLFTTRSWHVEILSSIPSSLKLLLPVRDEFRFDVKSHRRKCCLYRLWLFDP